MSKWLSYLLIYALKSSINHKNIKEYSSCRTKCEESCSWRKSCQKCPTICKYFNCKSCNNTSHNKRTIALDEEHVAEIQKSGYKDNRSESMGNESYLYDDLILKWNSLNIFYLYFTIKNIYLFKFVRLVHKIWLSRIKFCSKFMSLYQRN